MQKKCISLAMTIIMIMALALSGCNKSGGNDTKDESLKNTTGFGQDNNTSGNSDNNETEGETVEKFDVTTEYTEEELTEEFSAEELFDDNGSVSENISSDKNVILLNGNKISVTGTGTKVNGSDVTITKSGTYYVSGTLDDGQIIIDCEDDGTVSLVMNGASITCSDSAPIYCSQAKLLIVNLVKGTTTTLTDGKTYTYEGDTDEPNACLYCDDDMTINGSGNLVITGNYNNGITAKDILKIYNGNITVNAVNNGIKGKDGVVVSGGNITINCDGDGIKADNTSDTSKGYVLIEGGIITITSAQDGIQAETCMKITGGDIDILTGEGSGAESTGNNWGTMAPWGEGNTTSTDTVSMKGIKAGTDITITGGTIKIDSEDDSIHTNATITINGGEITVASGDDGIHADTEITISTGNINITKSYEGIESTAININGGKINLKASDDGLNAAGGDGSATNGRPGMNNFSGSSGTINITGGYLYVNADGDGIDSNGSVNMTGGEVYVDGPTNDGNGPLDYDSTFSSTGGTIVVCGSAGMLQSPTWSGNVYGVTVVFTSTQSAKTTVKITDSKGNVIVTYTPSKNFLAFEYGSEKLVKGETYTIYLNDTEYDTFTVSSGNTSVGNTSGGMGGMGNGGGMGGRPGRK